MFVDGRRKHNFLGGEGVRWADFVVVPPALVRVWSGPCAAAARDRAENCWMVGGFCGSGQQRALPDHFRVATRNSGFGVFNLLERPTHLIPISPPVVQNA